MTTDWNDLAELEQANKTITGNNLLLVDSNNLSYRFIRRSNYNSYDTEFIRTVTSLGKSYDAVRIINCFDYGKSYYRMEMLNSYKANRVEPTDPEEIKRKEEFFTVLNALPDMMPNEIVKLRGVEADDTIAYLATNLKDKYDHVWIVSSDKDIIQLVDDNVSIFNIFSRKEITKQSLKEDLDISPSEFMLSRIIEGDKGDNIIGIEGIGPKRAQTLAKKYKTLDSLIKALPLPGKAKYVANLNAGKETIINNEKLINLTKYMEKAITAGKEGEENLTFLKSLI